MFHIKAALYCTGILCLVSQGVVADQPIEHLAPESRSVRVSYSEQASTDLEMFSESFKKGDETRLAELIAQGADVNVTNKYGATPLFMAVLADSTKGARLLLSAGAKPNAQRPKTGETALFMAAQKKNFETVDALIKANADVNLAGERGLTPLFIANVMNANDIVGRLIQAGADPNISDAAKNTSPLYIAAERGNVENIHMLLEANAHIDERTASGATPLYAAAENGHLNAVAALVEAGADPHVGPVVDDLVNAPLVAARANSHDDVVALLEKGLPTCGGLETFKGWGVFWMENYFSLEADLKTTKNIDRKIKLRFIKTSIGDYAMDFNRGHSVHDETDKEQILVDGQKIYEGRWQRKVTADGSSSYVMPRMKDDVIEKMTKGREAELRVIADMSGEFLAMSVKFSLEDFSEALDRAKKKMSEVPGIEAAGRCRPFRGFGFGY